MVACSLSGPHCLHTQTLAVVTLVVIAVFVTERLCNHHQLTRMQHVTYTPLLLSCSLNCKVFTGDLLEIPKFLVFLTAQKQRILDLSYASFKELQSLPPLCSSDKSLYKTNLKSVLIFIIYPYRSQGATGAVGSKWEWVVDSGGYAGL